MGDKSDMELVKAAKAGDTRALEELLSRHEKQVYRFGLRMCGSEEQAREVLQETLLAAFQGIHAFRGEAELSTWLYQVARTHCLRARRQRAGAPVEHEPLDAPGAQHVPSSERTPDEASHARQLGEVLHTAILALPDTYREALILRDVEGLSAEEAARVVGIEVRALKSRLHRARNQLREDLTTLLGESTVDTGNGCPELAHVLAQDAAGDIDQATCVRLEEHLATCPNCSDACDSLQRTVSLCRRIPGDAVPAPVRAAVRQALTRALTP
ncbi:RNA polymerase subunit sigma [Corallococcus sp. H22C18031201]|uniref:sigma-70 family RNA polymerase sigma factor n=1 Tax=Citreicoccus inhibens TaxID=2849499 RepID=UPI000E73A52E|nr:sigma-70 family RNA polymerase sigma factor [Citreicoccus inhibens]MBU8896497.1 sigma-70 family RNA polymerase sigma factor [Citreicoccus inhibens]RJS18785.1 RNA polymerase subunit sigma [Corallococcus sp. H22C18031201]